METIEFTALSHVGPAMRNQGALTVVVDIVDGNVQGLDKTLRDIGDNVGAYPATCPIDFARLATVHFMRWVILDAAVVEGKQRPARLVLSTNYDLPLEDHLRELIAVCGPVLEDLYSQCQGYQRGQDLLEYLQRHQVDFAAFYCGTRGRSLRQIQNEKLLRTKIEAFLDTRVSAFPGTRDPQKQAEEAARLRAEVRRFVAADPALQWAVRPESAFWWRLQLYGPPVIIVATLVVVYALASVFVHFLLWAVPLALVGLLLILGLTVLVWRQAIVAKEKIEEQDAIKINVAQIKQLVEREDQVVQNQLSHLADVKPGWFRRTTLRVVLAAINLLARYIYIDGKLGSIPTIHFARWVILDDGRRVLFFSNFDGSWVNYLGDFIDKAAAGLTAIWSNTLGCPRASGLINDGARDEQRFKSWTRDHQIFTHVWYSAYPDLTVDNINANSKIRNGLFANLSPAAELEWASLL